jgi:signal recognition particle subunit SRP54
MADMMKKMGKGGMMKQAMKQMMGKGGMPDPSKMSPDQLEEAATAMQGKLPSGLGGLGGMGRGLTLPAGLSGLMKKK